MRNLGELVNVVEAAIRLAAQFLQFLANRHRPQEAIPEAEKQGIPPLQKGFTACWPNLQYAGTIPQDEAQRPEEGDVSPPN